MPGPDLSPQAIANLIVNEHVTVAAGVPTIWMGVLPELKGRDTSSLRAIPCGGSAVPKALSEGYREQVGLPILQAWGMTETSPVGVDLLGEVDARERPDERDGRPAHDRRAWRHRASRSASSRRARPIRCRGTARAVGELQVRGPWIAATLLQRRSGGRDRSPTTAGCGRATWPRSTPRATSASSTAPRTSSSRAASGSARSRSRTS